MHGKLRQFLLDSLLGCGIDQNSRSDWENVMQDFLTTAQWGKQYQGRIFLLN
jgi:hypothetical protein